MSRTREEDYRVKSCDGRLFQKITILRAGSGDCVVRPPTKEWIDAIERLGSDKIIYGKISIAIIPGTKSKYNNQLGCKLYFLPGDENGMAQKRTGKESAVRVWQELRDFKIADVDYAPERKPSPFGFSTNLEDLMALRDALSRAIKNMENLEKKFRPKGKRKESLSWELK